MSEPQRILTRRECPECGTMGIIHRRGCSEPLVLTERVYVAVDALPDGMRQTIEALRRTWAERGIEETG